MDLVGDSKTDSAMGQTGSVEGGTRPTQVTKEGGTEIATIFNRSYTALSNVITTHYT